MLKKLIYIIIAISVFGSAGLYSDLFIGAAKYIDRTYLNETVKDLWAVASGEDSWKEAASAAGDYNYAWLDNGEFIQIAHALGKMPRQNTIESFLNSRQAGYRFFEVDLWLDTDGYLRCHHGPNKPITYRDGDCTFHLLLLEALRDDPQWQSKFIILDIKSDFEKTAQAVKKALLEKPDLSTQIIFQLYQPSHIHVFNEMNTGDLKLPGPIVTIYNNKRGLGHIYRALTASNIKALTVPLKRYKLIDLEKRRDASPKIFTHPVNGCQAWREAKTGFIKGVYMGAYIRC